MKKWDCTHIHLHFIVALYRLQQCFAYLCIQTEIRSPYGHFWLASLHTVIITICAHIALTLTKIQFIKHHEDNALSCTMYSFANLSIETCSSHAFSSPGANSDIKLTRGSCCADFPQEWNLIVTRAYKTGDLRWLIVKH